jgi:serine protease Do
LDVDLDIAILTTDVDMPSIIKLSEGIEIGDALLTIGSPQSTALSATLGFLAEKGRSNIEDKHAGWFQGSMAITHGNSGGPVFDPNKEDLVGVVTAVLGEPGKQAPNITFFIGYIEINKFIGKNVDKIKKFKKKS